jgi:hypothetical protein
MHTGPAIEELVLCVIPSPLSSQVAVARVKAASNWYLCMCMCAARGREEEKPPQPNICVPFPPPPPCGPTSFHNGCYRARRRYEGSFWCWWCCFRAPSFGKRPGGLLLPLSYSMSVCMCRLSSYYVWLCALGLGRLAHLHHQSFRFFPPDITKRPDWINLF